MSVERHDVIDAASTRDGWAVLTIHQFDAWEPVDERSEQLRAKLQTYERFVLSNSYQMHFCRFPVRIEIVSVDPLPQEIQAICRQWGVVVRDD